MRICRFLHGGRILFGLVEGDRVTAIEENSPFGPLTPAGESLRLSAVKLLVPVLPSKIIAVGRNYRAHAAELDNEVPAEPLLFMKAPSALLNPGDTIRLPPESSRVDYEGEVVVVVGRPARNLAPAEHPLDYVLGFTCGNDVTARDLQKRDGQFMRSKSFDSFAPVGPWIETSIDASDIQIETRVNGAVKQQGRTKDLIFPIDHLIRYIARVMTLLPGDLLFTGTPAGVGPLHAGDRVDVEIVGIGTLSHTVAAGE